MTERPIFVVGFQRSGTTLLQSLLGGHPRIAAPPELHFFFRIYELRDYWGDLQDDARASAALHELLHAPFGLLDACGFDEVALLDRFTDTDRSYRALLTTVLDDFASRSGKPRWSEKTPQQQPQQIWSLLPDAQIVHIVRDPREVVGSAASAWRHDVAPWLLARRCRDFVLAADSAGAKAPGSYLRIRYEDLAGSAESVLRQVCAFLGEDFAAEMLTSPQRTTAVPASGSPWQAEAAQPVRPAQAQWSSRLGPLDRALVTAEIRGVLAPFGYPPPTRAQQVVARLAAPWRLPGLLRDRRQRRAYAHARTPAERYAATTAFVRERERLRSAPAGTRR
jgi:hypothetical protein